MRRFTQLCLELDQAGKAHRKIEALVSYFQDAEPVDAAWGLYILMGRKLNRIAGTPKLREWVQQEAALPGWLMDESQEHVGDLAEAFALMLPGPTPEAGGPPPLHELLESVLPSLRRMTDAQQRDAVAAMWRRMDSAERWVWHKLLSGVFRTGVSESMLARVLALGAGVDPAVMAQRLSGRWNPTETDFLKLITGDPDSKDAGRPYPFLVATEVEFPDAGGAEALGEVEQWQAEWLWDGIRTQLIFRSGRLLLWSGDQELITERYPELARMDSSLPDGVVIDGVVMAWRGGRALPREELDARQESRPKQAMLWEDVPVVYMACDLLEFEGRDIRAEPMEKRRLLLETLVAPLQASEPIVLSPLIKVDAWDRLDALRGESRKRAVSGIMLKRRGSAYAQAADQTEGEVQSEDEDVPSAPADWQEWKATPLRIRAILTGAQTGEPVGVPDSPQTLFPDLDPSPRPGLFNDYTFALLDPKGELVTIGRAPPTGLKHAEITDIDTFVRKNVTGKFGPVRAVAPTLVFELAFDGVRRSTRHQAGLTLRNARVVRWCRDIQARDADRVQTLERMRHG